MGVKKRYPWLSQSGVIAEKMVVTASHNWKDMAAIVTGRTNDTTVTGLIAKTDGEMVTKVGKLLLNSWVMSADIDHVVYWKNTVRVIDTETYINWLLHSLINTATERSSSYRSVARVQAAGDRHSFCCYDYSASRFALIPRSFTSW